MDHHWNIIVRYLVTSFGGIFQDLFASFRINWLRNVFFLLRFIVGINIMNTLSYGVNWISLWSLFSNVLSLWNVSYLSINSLMHYWVKSVMNWIKWCCVYNFSLTMNNAKYHSNYWFNVCWCVCRSKYELIWLQIMVINIYG